MANWYSRTKQHEKRKTFFFLSNNSFGKVNDNDNLFVNDSSLINNDLLKNPQGTILVIALRNVNHFLENITVNRYDC